MPTRSALRLTIKQHLISPSAHVADPGGWIENASDGLPLRDRDLHQFGEVVNKDRQINHSQHRECQIHATYSQLESTPMRTVRVDKYSKPSQPTLDAGS